MFYLWSIRGNGWLTKGGTSISDRKRAALFSEAEMRDMCKAHYQSGWAEYGLLPVSAELLEEIAK